MFVFRVLLISVLMLVAESTKRKSSNIVLIVADDLGWNDISFHGSNQILTPNIDLLSLSGKGLGRYYSHCICTPSRSALMTGKYAHRIGMQGFPLSNSEDRGLPTNEKILPQYLKELGYSTHLVGKWHIGESRTEFLPTERGFDSHFGHRGGFLDYYEYTLDEKWATGTVTGYGLFKNKTAAWGVEGYLTDVYTEEAKKVIKNHDKKKPLFLMLAHNAPHSANEPAIVQAPPEDVRAMKHVEKTGRRIFAAMMKKLDDGIGEVVEALHNKGILDNTVIVFIADNGGMTSGFKMNYASNWPLRGLKMTPFEGGVRVPGLIWSQDFKTPQNLWNGYIHVTDWLPIFMNIAGAAPPNNISGIDLWNSIKANEDSSRQEMYEIDDRTGFASVIYGDFKLVTGHVTEEYSDYEGGDLRGIIGEPPSYNDAIEKSKVYGVLRKIGKPVKKIDYNLRKQIEVKCDRKDTDEICYPNKDKICLYNIKEDPCETRDVSKENPDIVVNMLQLLKVELTKTVPRTDPPLASDPRSLPSLQIGRAHV